MEMTKEIHSVTLTEQRKPLGEVLVGLWEDKDKAAVCQRVIGDLVRITGGRWWICERGGVMVELGPVGAPSVMRFWINKQTTDSVVGAIEERLPDGNLRRVAGIELHLNRI